MVNESLQDGNEGAPRMCMETAQGAVLEDWVLCCQNLRVKIAQRKQTPKMQNKVPVCPESTFP